MVKPMPYRYGASFQCFVMADPASNCFEAVGSDEESTSISAVSNTLDDLEQYIIDDEKGTLVDVDFTREHPYVGCGVEDNGVVVSVITHLVEGEREVLAVIFTEPDLPVVIEV